MIRLRGYFKLIQVIYLVPLVLSQACMNIRTVLTDAISSTTQSVTCSPEAAPFGGGDGSPTNPFLICSIDQFKRVGSDDYINSDFILKTDINLKTESDFVPFNFTGGYAGTFDGENHIIANYTYVSSFSNLQTSIEVGLFRRIATAGTVKNLTIRSFKMEGYDYVGALVGLNEGTISEVSVSSSSIVGYDNVGGLVGYNMGSIANSLSAAKVIGMNASIGGVGGLVGYNFGGTITESASAGIVAASISAGGFVGTTASGGMISRSFSISDVFVSPQNWNGYQFGGFSGINTDVVDCYSVGTVYGEAGADYLGGFTGINYDTISTSYSASPSVSVAVPGATALGAFNGYDGAVTDSYFHSYAGIPANTSAATGLVTGLMRMIGSFTNFDVVTPIWKEDLISGYPFPILEWQPDDQPFFGLSVVVTPYVPIDLTQVSFPNTFAATPLVGDASPADEIITVTNNSGSDISISNISMSHGLSFYLGGTGTCTNNTALPNGSSCTVAINFTPDQSGPKGDALIITYSENGNVRKMAHLVTANAIDATLTESLSTADFADTPVSNTSAIVTYTINNNDGNDGTITNIQLASGADFSISASSTCIPTSVIAAYGGSCTVDLEFTPTSTGVFTDTVVITYENTLSTSKVVEIPLRATGI
jgi:hypothetical protein